MKTCSFCNLQVQVLVSAFTGNKIKGQTHVAFFFFFFCFLNFWDLKSEFLQATMVQDSDLRLTKTLLKDEICQRLLRSQKQGMFVFFLFFLLFFFFFVFFFLLFVVVVFVFLFFFLSFFLSFFLAQPMGISALLTCANLCKPVQKMSFVVRNYDVTILKVLTQSLPSSYWRTRS